MFSPYQIESLSELKGTILSVYLNIGQENATHHLLVPESLVWLRKAAKSLSDKLKSAEHAQFETQMNRVETFLASRHSHEKALAIFTGPNRWELVPLHVRVENDLRWGRPAISQLLLLTEEHKPYCVVVVDNKRARFFRYQFAELIGIKERPFSVDASQWKILEMGHVTGQRVHKTRGSQRDAFDHRVQEQYTKLCREAAREAATICRREKLSGIFLVGASRLVEPMSAAMPADIRDSVGLLCEDLGGFPVIELGHHLSGPIREWERRGTEALVQNLLGADRGVVTEPDEVLAQLQKGAIGKLVVTSDFPLSLRVCDRCNWTDRTADPTCPKCGASRHDATLKEMLPLLAQKYKTEVHVVDSSAAARLRELGGLGGWHREMKQAAARSSS
jgi:Bacterial archaeo-eukaryotic release factor family 10